MTLTAQARLAQTNTFRDQGFDRWEQTTKGIIGCGMVGSRVAVESVRSGASVRLYDFERVDRHNNLATPGGFTGTCKVDAVRAACEQIRPGAASGTNSDIRHVGIGDLRKCDVLIDCTDDARLAFPLTQISNGLQLPLLRVAVDGSGRLELGRVLCSDVRNQGSCQMCTYTFQDLARPFDRTPCPGMPTVERPSTLAGGALASAMAGIVLLQSQRLVTRNDMELVRDREVIVDLSHQQIMSAEVRRSPECISGHETWETTDVPAESCTCLDDIYREAAGRLGTSAFSLEPFNHPFCIEAGCRCGSRCVAVGTIWATPPTCGQCGQEMTWRTDSQIASLHHGQAAHLGVLRIPLAELGLPATDAMFVARVAHKTPLRLVLASADESNI